MAAWEKDRIYHDENEQLKELFVGRRVIAAEGDVLTLDDGTRVTVDPNEGCGGCPSGWYTLERIAAGGAAAGHRRGEENGDQRVSASKLG